MQAVIETGGKQYRVSEGDVIYIEKLPLEAQAKVTFDKVLAVTGDGDLQFRGRRQWPAPQSSAALSKTAERKRSSSYKMHAKKNYRRKQGHRQAYTKVQIEKISV